MKPSDRYLKIVAKAIEGEFDSFDSECHRCEPRVTRLLEDYLARHREQFVGIV